MANEVKVPVRTLAEYVYRSGSIVSGLKTAASFTEGTRIHREIQGNYQEGDKSEVFLKTEINYAGLHFYIDGRCDGILLSGERVVIDEIKSTSINLEHIDEDTYEVHWAQAYCYGYMYLENQDFDSIDIQLTYVHKTSGSIKRFVRTKSRGELKEYFLFLVAGFAPYAKLRIEHEKARDRSIQDLDFPFPAYRKGQRRLAGSVYKTIMDEQTLFASAPTGIGKTISTIFPTVKGIGEGHLQKLFYLTAKTTTRQTGEEAFDLMAANGLTMKVVTITAKEKVCFTREGKCSKEFCEFADGYYDRINDAVLDILENEALLNRVCIEKYAMKHKVCPFEFSLDLAYAADAVICDYNYIFDPKVSLKRLFDEQKKQTVLLVDEAHNLVDRGREMFSASLEKAPFLELKRTYKNKNKPLFEACRKMNDHFIKIRKQADGDQPIVFNEPLSDINDLAVLFCELAEEELLRGQDGSQELLLETYFTCQDWLRIDKLFGEEHVLYAVINKNDVRLKQFCLDPSRFLRHASRHFKARVFFSATLSPINYYKEMLGGETDNYSVFIRSPFSPEQTDVYLRPLSTRFHDRQKSISPIVKTIADTIKARPGNYLIFFPSYQYLHSVLEEWANLIPEVQTIVQGVKMDDEERGKFLASFQENPANSVAGFAVLGGIFSEGIDLKGERLNGVVVVGVGLPQIGFERDLIKQFFSAAGKNGYDYAYVLPGMNKVLQAGGRLIRSEKDTGTLVLIDDRYLQHKYMSLLPEEWRGFSIV